MGTCSSIEAVDRPDDGAEGQPQPQPQPQQEEESYKPHRRRDVLPVNATHIIRDLYPVKRTALVADPEECDSLSVLDCISHAVLFELLLNVTSRHFAEESVLFLKDLLALRDLVERTTPDSTPSNKLTAYIPTFNTEKAHRARVLRTMDFVVSEYLRDDSPMCVNISASMRQRFLSAYDAIMGSQHAPVIRAGDYPRTPRASRHSSTNCTPAHSPSSRSNSHSSHHPSHHTSPNPSPHASTQPRDQAQFHEFVVTRLDEGSEEHMQPSVSLHTDAYNDREDDSAPSSGVDPMQVMKLFEACERTVTALIDTNFLHLVKEKLVNPPQIPLSETRGRCRVVVIGGGFCGAYCVRRLSKDPRVHVTLVDPKEFLEYIPTMPKVIARPSFHDSITVPHKRYLHSGELVVGHARVVRAKYVTVGCRDIPYDKVVIATGSHYPSCMNAVQSLTTQFRKKQLQANHRHLHKARSVLIIGGGVVGVELATEIRERFPRKKITIVHHAHRLLNNLPMSSGCYDYAEAFLQKHRIRYILNEEILAFDDEKGCFLGTSGREYKAQRAFWAGGPLPQSSLLGPEFSHCLDMTGHVKVNDKLQLDGHPNMFAGGDASNFSFFQVKTMVGRARRHGIVIAQNILRDVYQKDTIDYHDTLDPELPMVVSLGSQYGIWVKKKQVKFGEYVAIKDKMETWILTELREGKTMVPRDKLFSFDFHSYY